MAERSFAREVEDLQLGAGEVFRGEGILAITKALLQSGVSYVAGYQGSPISHLMDVLADAKDVLQELGVHFETSASEATAAATLSASVMYPLARRRDLEIDRRHQCRRRRALQPVLGRRHRRRADHHRRGLRRRLVHHAGAQPRLCAEIADLAPRSAPQSADAGAHGRGRLRTLRGLEHAGHAGSADPHLPRARPVRLQGQSQAGLHPARGAGESGRATSAASCCRPPLSCTRRRSSKGAGRRRSSS